MAVPVRRQAGLWMTGLLLAIQPNIIVLSRAGGVTLYLPELAIWAVFIPLALALLLTSREDPLSAGLAQIPEIYVYLFIAAMAALLTLGLDGSSATPGKVKNLMPAVLLASLVVLVARDLADLRWLVIWMTVGAAANAVLGISQFTTGGPMVVPPHENNIWKEALDGGLLPQTANGFFDTPNALGIALAPALVLAARLCVGAEGWNKLFMLFAAVVAAGLVISAHRGALVWALMGCLVAFWPARRKAGLAILAFIAPATVLTALGVLGTMSGSTGTLATRVRLWEGAAWFLSQDPMVLFFGNGDAADRFSRVAAQYADWALPMTHNTFLDQILFFGIFALFAYLAAWALALRRVCAVRCKRTGGDGAVPLADGLIGALVALAGLLVLEPRADGVYSIGQVLVLFAISARLYWLDQRALTRP